MLSYSPIYRSYQHAFPTGWDPFNLSHWIVEGGWCKCKVVGFKGPYLSIETLDQLAVCFHRSYDVTGKLTIINKQNDTLIIIPEDENNHDYDMRIFVVKLVEVGRNGRVEISRYIFGNGKVRAHIKSFSEYRRSQPVVVWAHAILPTRIIHGVVLEWETLLTHAERGEPAQPETDVKFDLDQTDDR
jgi:hypothetical protein